MFDDLNFFKTCLFKSDKSFVAENPSLPEPSAIQISPGFHLSPPILIPILFYFFNCPAAAV